MGVKRISRGKLLNTEKLGIEKKDDINISDVMRPALISATQHREGHKVTTDLLYDFGTSKINLKTLSVGVNDPIGDVANSNNDSYLCQVQQSVFGVVTTVETICLEAFSDGTMTNVDLVYGDNDGYLGNDAGNDASFASDAQEDIMTAVGQRTISIFDGSELDTNGSSGKFLYLVAGAASSKKATATIDCSAATVANVLSGSTQIRLIDEAGDPYTIIADSSRAWDAAYATGKFGTGPSVGSGTPAFDTRKRLAYSISTAIHGHGSFNTNAASRTATGGGGSNNGATDNLEVVTVTQAKTATATADENKTNFFTDVAHSLSGIVVGDFSGGAPHDIVSGKLLIRLTGFIEPDDL